MKITLLISISVVVTTSFAPPSIVSLRNPSFEGEPRDAVIPEEWYACGAYSTPDLLPGPWGVYKEAAHGDTFLGLISREDGTWEGIGQHLDMPLKADECYEFSVKLARSTGYVGYNKPLKFRFWGGTKKCQKMQILGQSAAVLHDDWKRYRFSFFPNKDYDFIVFEVHYAEDTPYRGNLLIDDCSDFEPCIRASIF